MSGLASLSIGTVLGFSAILLPQLESEEIIEAKSEEGSWIGKSTVWKFKNSIATKILREIDPYDTGDILQKKRY